MLALPYDPVNFTYTPLNGAPKGQGVLSVGKKKLTTPSMHVRSLSPLHCAKMGGKQRLCVLEGGRRCAGTA